jgi:hypothetical protein
MKGLTPAGWDDVLVRTVVAAIIAFVALQAKEWFDAGAFDTPAAAFDAGLIAAFTFLWNALLAGTGRPVKA